MPDPAPRNLDAASAHDPAAPSPAHRPRRLVSLALTALVMLATLGLNQLSYALTLWALRTSIWAIPALGLLLTAEVALTMFLWERVPSIARGLLWGFALSIGLQLLLMAALILNVS
jgi:hypothetical protein